MRTRNRLTARNTHLLLSNRTLYVPAQDLRGYAHAHRGRVVSVEAWDGKDGVLPKEEPLEAFDD